MVKMCMGSVKSIKLDFCKSCGRMAKGFPKRLAPLSSKTTFPNLTQVNFGVLEPFIRKMINYLILIKNKYKIIIDILPLKFILKIINKSFILMTDILITEFINKEKLKEQLIKSVWKPKIKTYICRRDREPKRKLLINLEVNDINKIIDKTKKIKNGKNGKNGKKKRASNET